MSPSPLAAAWDLDPKVSHLNHGSFGAAPRVVLERQAELRRHIEANPMQFFSRELSGLLDAARERLAAFVGANPSTMAFVPNASTGVNAVLRSLRFTVGDEILVTDHGYGAATNAVHYVAERSGASVVTAGVRLPITTESDVVDAVLERVSRQTRLAVIDHITSSTGLVWPIESIVARLRDLGVPVMVDGAHAPGMLDLDVAALGATYYTGNCHKWLCAPKGAAFLVVDPEAMDDLVPVVVGWGLTSAPEGRSQFHAHFDWVGTDDPTPYLCVPDAIDAIASLAPGGWPEIRLRNHDLVTAGRAVVAAAVGADIVAPESMMGSMAIVPMSPGSPDDPFDADPLQSWLAESARIEVPVTRGPTETDRWLRLSAHAYNDASDYERLAEALRSYEDSNSNATRGR